jgi:plastocyanin
MYRWWVFVHVIGVFAFLAAHGVSMVVLFRLRTERDPHRVAGLLEISGFSAKLFYPSLGLLVVAGVVAGFLGHWWSQAWIWVAIAILVLATLAMYALATPYYRRVGTVARALAGGSHAVSEEQFDELLGSDRPWWVAATGAAAILFILYLMLFKPTFGTGSAALLPPPPPSGAAAGPTVRISADNLAFDTNRLTAPADKRFTIVFVNQDVSVPHNVAVYTDSSANKALSIGKLITGPATADYRVPALPAGTYFFRCDVHPQMNGTLTAR